MVLSKLNILKHSKVNLKMDYVMETEYVSNSMEIVIGEIGKLELRKVKVG